MSVFYTNIDHFHMQVVQGRIGGNHLGGTGLGKIGHEQQITQIDDIFAPGHVAGAVFVLFGQISQDRSG